MSGASSFASPSGSHGSHAAAAYSHRFGVSTDANNVLFTDEIVHIPLNLMTYFMIDYFYGSYVGRLSCCVFNIRTSSDDDPRTLVAHCPAFTVYSCRGEPRLTCNLGVKCIR